MELRPFDLLGHTLGASLSLGLGNSSITQNAPAAKIASKYGNWTVSLQVSAVTWCRAEWWLCRYGLLLEKRKIRPHLRKCRATVLPAASASAEGNPIRPWWGLGLEHQCGSQRQKVAAAAAVSLTSGVWAEERKTPRKWVSYRCSECWDFGNAVHTPTNLSGVHLCTA